MAVNTKAYIADSSAILATLLPDEKTKATAKKIISLLEKYSIFSCSLLKYEICNSLKSAYLQKRITQKATQTLWENFLKIPITYLPINFPQTFKLAIRHHLSVYDATYLHLAKIKKAPLISLDTTLTNLATSSPAP